MGLFFEVVVVGLILGLWARTVLERHWSRQEPGWHDVGVPVDEAAWAEIIAGLGEGRTPDGRPGTHG
jgi:hypothetical protein